MCIYLSFPPLLGILTGTTNHRANPVANSKGGRRGQGGDGERGKGEKGRGGGEQNQLTLDTVST